MPNSSLSPFKNPRFSVMALAVLAVFTLSGCGGGGITNGSSSTIDGFRIVPAGGDVIPLPNDSVILETDPGVVSVGVQVTAVAIGTSSLPTSPAAYTPVSGGAYQLTFDPAQPTLNNSVTLQLQYPASTAPSTAATFRIFTYSNAEHEWIVLPGSSVNPSNSTISAYMNGTGDVPGTAFPFDPGLSTFSDSGLYAIFQSTTPAAP